MFLYGIVEVKQFFNLKVRKEMGSISKYHFKGEGLEKVEKKSAKKLFDDYRKNYSIDTLSDLQLLEALVYREVIQIRYKKKIEDVSKSKTVKEANIIPKNLLEYLDDNLEHILTLKEKLGLFSEDKKDEYKAFEVLEKKFDIWKKNHLEERKVTCPHCSKIFFLNIRTDKFKENKLELFKNKVLCNEHLWVCYKDNKITKEDMAKVLNVSPDYIDWLEEKIYPTK